jgi:hypothetical protein
MRSYVQTVLLLAALLLAPPKYDEEKLPYRVAWGAYTVTVEKLNTGEYAPERVRILDSRGHVVREIRDQRFVEVNFDKLTGKPPFELHVGAFSGGAHCCFTDYWFTQEGGLRNLLIFDGGNGGVAGIKDLSHNGRPEIIAGNDALAYFGDLSYAASPTGLIMVIGWNGKRYVDQTRRYPQEAQKAIASSRQAILEAARQPADTREETRRSGAAGYYAGMLTIGRGPEARRWLLKTLPMSTRTWLLAHEQELKKALAASESKIRVSQAKVLSSSFSHP